MRSVLGFAVWSAVAVIAVAQDFELVEPSGVVAAQARIRPGRLVVIEQTGDRVYFSREPLYDTSDGDFTGYFNIDLNRIVRFPRSGRGRLQSADLDDFSPHFRWTRRSVRPIRVAGGGPVLGPGYFDPGFGVPGYGFPGFGPPGFGAPFFGSPFVPVPGFASPYPIGPPQPQSVLIDSETIPYPPLPPVGVELRNDSPRELQVGIVDRLEPGKTQSIRIAPGRSKEVTLQRDAGAKQIQNFRVITPLGDSVTREIVNDVPPPVRYEIVVHQWQVQSVAIDRTSGAGDNPIEDINFNGKSIGRFPLPPGAELTAGTIDVYRAARSRGNQHTVAPILAGEDDPDAQPTPLERAILEAQQNFRP